MRRSEFSDNAYDERLHNAINWFEDKYHLAELLSSPRTFGTTQLHILLETKRTNVLLSKLIDLLSSDKQGVEESADEKVDSSASETVGDK